MTDDLNKQWAELEGWEYLPKESVYDNDGYVGWINSNGKEAKLPNWTEPNRFFAEVVPRMAKLGLFLNCFTSKANGQWRCSWYQTIQVGHYISESKEIGIAGLTAAIQAREKMGNE